ncbi:SGNH/GDSL hydrolase family protein [Aliarcobacter butzleri]|uniref:SGNH/GDSL hydrolase family protein n=1 Tax=Aliarcobacter butzleri TaxID=28197 RepID=UPI0021B4852C|nr:hypothetical protein [Aliarcobacter butzleri]MCT7602552.1 hypothetical protein [Aliarcobacter butzleri]
MIKLTNKLYVLMIILLSIIFLLSIFLIIYLYLKTYEDSRIYSIRKVPEEYRVSLVNNFINNNYKKDSILLLGDSQPKGHMYPTKYIFSNLLENKLKKKIINLAFDDSRILDNIYIIEYLYQNNMKFETLIFNVNQSHIKQNDFSRLKEQGLFPKDFLIGIFVELKSFIQLVVTPNPKFKPNEEIIFLKYENYFEIEQERQKEYFQKLEIFINLAKKISDNVIIYITPHSINAVKHNNENDIEILNKFSQDIIKFCENKGIKCIDIDITEDNYYIDIVHFNSKGHEKMSEILYNSLK